MELIISLLTWPFWCHGSYVTSIFSLLLLLVLSGRRHFCRQQGCLYVCLAQLRPGGGGALGKGCRICGCQPKVDLNDVRVIKKCVQMALSKFHTESTSLTERAGRIPE